MANEAVHRVEATGGRDRTIVEWPLEASVLALPMVENRNRLARQLADGPLSDVLDLYVGLSEAVAVSGFNRVLDDVRNAGIGLAGTGIEVGAGIGVFSAMLVAREAAVDTIYALELVPEVTRRLLPRVTNHFAGMRADRIVPVIGSFDDICLPDHSLDFCIEYASLHHSDDLAATLKEIARVLKPGAPLIAVDRSHTNALSEVQRTFMLDLAYSAAWKRKNGYPEDPLDRRTNGEHEIRLSEWEDAFAQAGFLLVKRRELRPLSWSLLRRKLFLSLPFSLRRRMGWLPSRASPQRGEVAWMLRSLGTWASADAVYRTAPKEHTLFIATRLGPCDRGAR